MKPQTKTQIWMWIAFIIIVTAPFWSIGIQSALSHENKRWRDMKGTGPMYGYESCGMGYYMMYNENKTVSYLLHAAGHWHKMEGIFPPTYTCNDLFKLLQEEPSG